MISRIIDIYRKYFWAPIKYARSIGVEIGDNCSIAIRYFGSEPYLIKIGSNVQITNGVRLFTHGGNWVVRRIYKDFDSFGKIVIGDNVYIGNNALILPGVIIGSNVIIGAGSVVTKSIPNNKIVAGNPVRIICELDDFYIERMKKFNVSSKGMKYDEKKKYLLNLPDESFIKKKSL